MTDRNSRRSGVGNVQSEGGGSHPLAGWENELFAAVGLVGIVLEIIGMGGGTLAGMSIGILYASAEGMLFE